MTAILTIIYIISGLICIILAIVSAIRNPPTGYLANPDIYLTKVFCCLMPVLSSIYAVLLILDLFCPPTSV